MQINHAFINCVWGQFETKSNHAALYNTLATAQFTHKTYHVFGIT